MRIEKNEGQKGELTSTQMPYPLILVSNLFQCIHNMKTYKNYILKISLLSSFLVRLSIKTRRNDRQLERIVQASRLEWEKPSNKLRNLIRCCFNSISFKLDTSCLQYFGFYCANKQFKYIQRLSMMGHVFDPSIRMQISVSRKPVLDIPHLLLSLPRLLPLCVCVFNKDFILPTFSGMCLCIDNFFLIQHITINTSIELQNKIQSLS